VARDARAEHERRFLVSAVAHDLRTPLFTLRGYLEGMDHGLDDGSYVGRAREKADLLDRLVSDLFAYSRWELLDEPPRREPVELGELARRAAGTVAERAHGRAVAIEPGGPPLTVVADGHLLTRVFANLLDNAVRHSPPDTTVQLRWQRRDGVAVIEVADHGPGLDPSEIPRLFEPLYRGDAARNSRTGGAGLGLAIARRLVDAHGGTVTAANRPGGGACFTVTLPLEGAGSGALVGPHRGAVGADLGPGRAQL
jgi:signal transduction histidine kinase